MTRTAKTLMTISLMGWTAVCFGDGISLSQSVVSAEGGPISVELVRPAGGESPQVLVVEGDESANPVTMRLSQSQGGKETWTGVAILPDNPLQQPITCKVQSDDYSQDVMILPRGKQTAGNGLRATYYFDETFVSSVTSRQESIPMLNGNGALPHQLNGKPFSAIWEGLLTAEFSGETNFVIDSTQSVRLMIDGRTVVSRNPRQSTSEASGKVMMEAGRKYMFRVEYSHKKGNPSLGIDWIPSGQPRSTVPQRQFSTLENVRPAATISANVQSGRQSISYKGGTVVLDGSIRSRLGDVKAWVEVTSAADETIRMAVGESLDLPCNDDEEAQTYKVMYKAVDASGFVTAIPGPEYVVRPEKEPIVQRPAQNSPRVYVPGRTPQPSSQPRWQDNEPVWTGSSNDLVNRAMEYRGVRYIWGGTNLSRGVDCSGFIQGVFRQFGRRLPRVARDQATVGMRITSMSQLTPGDRLYFRGGSRPGITHTGLYIGGGQMVHASMGRGKIVVDNLSGRYWQNNFAWGMR